MVNLNDKTILVTGASDGIGKQTALELAGRGARVLLHGRDRQRLERTQENIQKATSSENLGLYLADFSSLAEVQRMAQEILDQEECLDVLVNNAGVYTPKPSLSAEGYELSFAVNHLAHFLLTMLLLDLLKASAPARIVVVASTAHSSRDIDYQNLCSVKSTSRWYAYERSKLANILFTYYLADQL